MYTENQRVNQAVNVLGVLLPTRGQLVTFLMTLQSIQKLLFTKVCLHYDPKEPSPLAALLMLGVGWEAGQGSQAGLCQVLGPHHHGHRLEGVVTEPQLPDYAPVVTVVITRAKVLAVQV